MPTNTYTPLATYTVPSNSTSDITFSSIPQTYKHLLIKVQQRSTQNTGEAWSFVRITSIGGTASNLYQYYSRFTLGMSSDVQQLSLQNYFYGNGPLSVASAFGHLELYIPDYASSSKYKTFHFSMHGGGTADDNFYHAHGAGMSDENTAISTITFSGSYGWVAGSNITLYGLSNS
jgi:hypothetical protein